MPQGGTVFDDLNQRIWDFIHEPANRRLRPGTGHYSTLFRGGLFGHTKSSLVAEALKNRRVEVMWLGSNPNMARSLAQILETPDLEGDLPDFRRQIDSGFLARVVGTTDCHFRILVRLNGRPAIGPSTTMPWR